MSQPEASSSTVPAVPAPTVVFKKGPRSRPVQSRKRSPSPPAPPPSNADSTIHPPANDTTVVRPLLKSGFNPLVQGTKRRRDATDTVDDLNGDQNRAHGGLDEFDYRADVGLIKKGDDLATRSADWDLESVEKKDEKKVKLNEDGEIDDGLYRGTAHYLPTINKNNDVLDKKMKSGPIRATANIRTITLVDYQPDVCKPYKETGFCGYGDSCKFLHDRGDYLAGWQLDKLDPTDPTSAPNGDEDDEEDLPFACLICRKEFNEPIITKCGHYFCMKCAIDRFVKSPKCYACGAATSGIFNKAEKILKKLEEKRRRRLEAKGVVEEDEDGGIEIGGAEQDADEDEQGERQSHGGNDNVLDQ